MPLRNNWKYNDPRDTYPQFSFDTFIVGKSNQLAYDAARKLANKSEPTSHTPLLIYGDIGIGKTHLLQAIENHVQAPGIKIRYASTETFTTELIAALQKTQIATFRELYRTYDFLLLDDVDSLAGKPRLISEIAFILEYLLLNQTSVAMTSGKHPAKIDGFSDKLLSLLQQRLIVPIKPPDHYEQMAILQKKAEAMKLDIDPASMESLAVQSDGDIRKMEGMLMQVAFLKQHLNK